MAKHPIITENIERTFIHELGRDEVMEMLNLYLSQEFDDLPADTQVFMNVPSGGDWSGMRLDVDNDDRLIVKYVRRETVHHGSTEKVE